MIVSLCVSFPLAGANTRTWYESNYIKCTAVALSFKYVTFMFDLSAFSSITSSLCSAMVFLAIVISLTREAISAAIGDCCISSM